MVWALAVRDQGSLSGRPPTSPSPGIRQRSFKVLGRAKTSTRSDAVSLLVPEESDWPAPRSVSASRRRTDGFVGGELGGKALDDVRNRQEEAGVLVPLFGDLLLLCPPGREERCASSISPVQAPPSEASLALLPSAVRPNKSPTKRPG